MAKRNNAHNRSSKSVEIGTVPFDIFLVSDTPSHLPLLARPHLVLTFDRLSRLVLGSQLTFSSAPQDITESRSRTDGRQS